MRSDESEKSRKGFTFSIASVKSRKGFTLIEILVVIAIMGIITSGAIAAYSNFNKAQTIQRVVLEIKSKLRESQNRSVAGLKHSDCKDDDNSDNVEDYMLKGHYVVFDTNSPEDIRYSREQICEARPGQLPPGDITVDLEVIALPPSITVSTVELVDNLDVTCVLLVGGQLVINFKPLNDGIDFYSGTAVTGTPEDCRKAKITLTDGSNSEAVEVDRFGLIDIE